MSIHIHNSLSRKKEEFVPVNPPQVNMYTCGVTVYDACHIGHARSLYIFDVIRKYLGYRGYQVNFTRNITDIDDKIINRANELKIDWRDLVKKYIESYQEDLGLLGIRAADSEPRATENIPAMVKYIQGLTDKGFAYEAGGDVYFNVRKFPGYGKLSGQGIDQMEKGARIEPSALKKDHLDFALWKRSKENEPSWDSPWGKGRPGWHIECSVMSQKFLKTEILDIHAGGRDLIFPHHENEIAQAEALTGKLFAKYWLHHGLLTINGQKMSKSLGNFITIRDFIEKYKNIDFLKLFFLSTHYAHPVDFTDDKIQEARAALERITILLGRGHWLWLKEAKPRPSGLQVTSVKEIDEIKDRFIAAMDDDFNMPQGLACVFELVNLANKNIEDADFALSAVSVIEELLGILRISIQREVFSDAEIEGKISERNQARKNKDFALSDEIRKALESEGIILEDTKDGTTWRRKI